jgi:excisionase family DNA binding protein
MPDIKRGPVTIEDLDGRNFAYPHEVAGILRCDVRTVRRAINDGQIPATRIGAAYRVPVGWLVQQTAGRAS